MQKNLNCENKGENINEPKCFIVELEQEMKKNTAIYKNIYTLIIKGTSF